ALIYEIVKLVYEESEPISIETSYIPCDVVPNLSLEEIEKHSTTRVLKNFTQHSITNSNQKITLVYTNQPESKLLSRDLGSPVMKHKGFVYDNMGNLVLFFENIMLMERFAFFRKLSN
ncbi:MAG: UTRA domain-containing protein, partial [Proteocatella sp.]